MGATCNGDTDCTGEHVLCSKGQCTQFTKEEVERMRNNPACCLALGDCSVCESRPSDPHCACLKR